MAVTLNITITEADHHRLYELQRACGASQGRTKVPQAAVIERLVRDADPEHYRKNFARLAAADAARPPR